MDYAMDCLCYNPTTRDWRTHDGMDYAAAAGTQVLAAADGTVYTVFEDERMGTTVVICHEDGYVTTYSSLDAQVAVSVGDVVHLGDVIGCVGSTALMESAIGDHVHFSVTCNGEAVDPDVFFQLN
jgi:murein DD-endopeptidase MepM/ murein hydrolase activator NlpD